MTCLAVELTGKVWFDGVRWVAVIDGGWWYASGKSEAEAVRKVTAKYYEEMERMTRWERHL